MKPSNIHMGGLHSWDKLVDIASNINSRRQSGANAQSVDGSQQFTGTRDMSEAVRLARDGWAKGTEQIAKTLDVLGTSEIVLPDWQLDVAGAFPCTPAFVAGEPECVWRRTDNLRDERRMTLVTPCGYPGMIDAKHAMNYAIGVAAVVRMLESQGIAVAVYSACISHDYTHGFVVRAHGEPMDLGKVAFSSHPSFLRRLNFAYIEQDKDIYSNSHCGYGGTTPESWGAERIRPLVGECGQLVILPLLWRGKDFATVEDSITAIQTAIQTAEQTVVGGGA